MYKRQVYQRPRVGVLTATGGCANDHGWVYFNYYSCYLWVSRQVEINYTQTNAHKLTTVLSLLLREFLAIVILSEITHLWKFERKFPDGRGWSVRVAYNQSRKRFDTRCIREKQANAKQRSIESDLLRAGVSVWFSSFRLVHSRVCQPSTLGQYSICLLYTSPSPRD